MEKVGLDGKKESIISSCSWERIRLFLRCLSWCRIKTPDSRGDDWTMLIALASLHRCSRISCSLSIDALSYRVLYYSLINVLRQSHEQQIVSDHLEISWFGTIFKSSPRLVIDAHILAQAEAYFWEHIWNALFLYCILEDWRSDFIH